MYPFLWDFRSLLLVCLGSAGICTLLWTITLVTFSKLPKVKHNRIVNRGLASVWVLCNVYKLFYPTSYSLLSYSHTHRIHSWAHPPPRCVSTFNTQSFFPIYCLHIFPAHLRYNLIQITLSWSGGERTNPVVEKHFL